MRPERAALLAAGVGLAGSALGWRLAPAAFAHGWLAAVVAFSGVPLGSMVLLLLHALTGGQWGEALRPGLRVGAATLPLLLLLIVPAFWLLPELYAWARPGAVLANGWYLNVSFAAVRGGIYATVWLGVAAAALILRRLDRIAAPALMLLAVTITGAAVDATMSLDPHFTSSLYGMLALAGIASVGLAVAVPLSGTPIAGGDIGKLLLALCVLWTYLDFMQLLIVWQSDLTTQTPWYRARTGAGWGWVMALVTLCHSVLPIGLLLSPQWQRDRRVLASVAWLLVGAEILRAWWTVVPEVAGAPGLIDVACMLGVGGAGTALALQCRRLGFVEHA